MSETIGGLGTLLILISVILAGLIYVLNYFSSSESFKRKIAYIKLLAVCTFSIGIVPLFLSLCYETFKEDKKEFVFLIIIVSLFLLISNIPKIISIFKDRKLNIQYYRDIPEKCSVAMASYLIGRHNKEDIIGGTALNIVSKGALRIQKENNEYIFVRGETPMSLKTDEVYLYNWYLKEDKAHFNMDEFEKIVLKELNDEQLAKAKYKVVFPFLKNAFLLLGITLCIYLGYYIIFPDFNVVSLKQAAWFLFVFIASVSGISAILNIKRKEIRLTKEGRNLKNKILGLKWFLKEFSAISIRTPEEVVLWESYLSYAVIFNINQKYKKMELPDTSLMNAQEREYIREKALSSLMPK